MENLSYYFQAIPAFILVVVVWMVLSSPFLLTIFLVARFLRSKTKNKLFSAILLSLLFALLAAPVPTPIITFFIPLVAFLYSGTNTPFHDEILKYALTSFFITWVLGFFLIKRYLVSAKGGFWRSTSKAI